MRGDEMAVSKIVYGRQTLIDLTADTITEETLFKGSTAHKADGTIITGIMFDGYPDLYSLYETTADSNGESILDKNGQSVECRVTYQKM